MVQGFIILWMILLLSQLADIKNELRHIKNLLNTWENDYQEFRDTYEIGVHQDTQRIQIGNA